MAFRGDGDRDFLGELTDPLPVPEEVRRPDRCRLPDESDRGRSMTVAPEIQSLIDWGDGRQRAARRPSAAGAAAAFSATSLTRSCADAASSSSMSTAVTDHEIPVSDGEVAARIYTPPGAGPHPVFLHLHGGGFVFGTVDSLFNAAKCAHICRAAECVVVTVNTGSPQSSASRPPRRTASRRCSGWSENADPLNSIRLGSPSAASRPGAICAAVVGADGP